MTQSSLTQNEVNAGFDRRNVFDTLKSHDVMHHRAVYAELANILMKFNGNFRMLDIGCGDCADILPLLLKRCPDEYVGVDSASEAIAQAACNLAGATFPSHLTCGDYRQALNERCPYDVIWMGLFLHHVPTKQKADFLQKAYGMLKQGGLLLAHDPLLQEKETRSAFIDRLMKHGRSNWPFLAADDLQVACRHWSEHGHQESVSVLRELGLEANFSEVNLLWSDPDKFYGLLMFRRN
jgi:cyclopropane fatty-acyl-phospholipid synthase-like methyltransferase